MNSYTYLKLVLLISLLSSCSEETKVVELVRYENSPVSQSELSTEQSLENYRKVGTFAEAQKTAKLIRKELQEIEQRIFNSPQSQIKKISNEIKSLAGSVARISKDDQDQLYNTLMANTDQRPATQHLAIYKVVDQSDAATELMFNAFYLKANNQKLDDGFSKYARKAIQALTNNISKDSQVIEAYFAILSGLNGQIDISELDTILAPITRSTIFTNLADLTAVKLYTELLDYWVQGTTTLQLQQAQSVRNLIVKHKDNMKLLKLALQFYELPSMLFEGGSDFSQQMIKNYDDIIYASLERTSPEAKKSFLMSLILKDSSIEDLGEKMSKMNESYNQRASFDRYRTALYSTLFEKIKLTGILDKETEQTSLENYKNNLVIALNIYRDQNYSFSEYFSQTHPHTFFEQNVRDELTIKVDLDEIIFDSRIGPGVYNAGKFNVSLLTEHDLIFHPLSLILTHSKDLTIKARNLIFPNIMTINNMSVEEKTKLTQQRLQQDWQRFYENNLPEVQSLSSTSIKGDQNPIIDSFCEKVVQNKDHWPHTDDARVPPLSYYLDAASTLTTYSLNSEPLQLEASNGIAGQSAGSVEITSVGIVHPFIWSKGEDGLNGIDGIEAKTFDNGLYEKTFSVGEVFHCSVKEIVATELRNSCVDDRGDRPRYDPSLCAYETSERNHFIVTPKVTERTVISYRMEAGVGSPGGNGGDVVLNTQQVVGTLSIVNTGGKKGKKGADAEGPTLIKPNQSDTEKSEDGKDGEVRLL